MKYKSDLIKDIVESRGHEKPSIHYESECIEKWIEETKGAYPKLCDYQSEWLNYINEKPIGNFPYEIITDVIEATVNNVVPYAYKSAILSGNTLVNLCDKTKSVFSSSGNKNLWQNALINTNPTQLTIINYTDKVIKYSVHNRTNDKWVSTNKVEANSKSLVNCGTNNYLKDLYGAYGDGWSNTEEDMDILKNGILVLEGDHTQEDITYFEGMQSIQMPVLTTSNEDGTETIILTVNEPIELRGIGNVKDELNLLTGEVTKRIGVGMLDGDENWEYQGEKTDTIVFKVNNNNIKNIDHHIISDRFPTNADGDVEKITNMLNVVYVAILKSKADNLKDFKSYLSQNPLTIQYQLANESIKTVDLSIQDQDGNTLSGIKPIEGTMHIHSDGTPLKPSITLEIPVEAMTQNLASFIKEE